MSERRPRPRDSAARAAGLAARGDTIVAVATAPGRAAVAIVRLSGADAERIGKRCVSAWPVRHRELTRCAVHAPDEPSCRVDDALVVVFPAPHSYTGETVVEVHGHGGMYTPTAIQAALVAAGARPALAGEFTERAVLNGKLDLVGAEAINELINARTHASHRAAMVAMSGMLSRQYSTLRDDAIGVEALVAYDIDFPDEDHGPVARERVDQTTGHLAEKIQALLSTEPAVILAREGAVVVLAGPPNAGKSSLLNALVGEARVIVSDEPGTTRDAIEVLLDADPWPIRVVDTAGLRDSPGAVERLGIEVSERYLRGADVVVVCADTHDALAGAVRRIAELSAAPTIQVLTKADTRGNDAAAVATDVISASAVTGAGLNELHKRIIEIVKRRAGDPIDLPTPVASARQRQALELAARELELFRDHWREGTVPAPVAATHLRAAVAALDHLIGAIDIDEVFSRVFATFCVGK